MINYIRNKKLKTTVKSIIGILVAFVLVSSSSVVALATDSTPSNPNASLDTRKLLEYLAGLANGNSDRVISGQFIGFLNYWDNDPGYKNDYKPLLDAGYPPGIMSIDLAFHDAQDQWPDLPHIIDHWNAGGLVTISWHAPSPFEFSGNYGSDRTFESRTTRDLSLAATPGTASNDKLKEMLDFIVVPHLQELKDEGVVVMWRPYHEMNGDWFWWGNQQNPQGYKELWQWTFDYLTNEKGLDNLLWVYSASDGWDSVSYIDDPFNMYPGDDYVDIFGLEKYSGSTTDLTITGYDYVVQNSDKPLGLAEFGPSLGISDYDYSILIDAIKTKYPEYIYFLAWSGSWAMDTHRNADILLNDPWVINRDEIDWSSGVTPPAEPTISFTSSSGSSSEAGETINAVISASSAVSQDTTISYSVNTGSSTATLGSDVTVNGSSNTTGSVVMASGSATVNLPIQIVNDVDDENNETLVVTITGASGATLGTPLTYTLTISDNDNSGPVTEYIFDNDDPEFSASGNWERYEDQVSNHYNNAHYYLSAPEASEDDVATFQFTITPGQYNLYAWWPAENYRPTDVPYQIDHIGGQSVVTVDQTTNGGQWNLLGTYDFDEVGTVEITDEVSSGRDIVADAIRLELVEGGSCTPDCSGKSCGDDGCGGSCGTCQTGYSCTDFACVQDPSDTEPHSMGAQMGGPATNLSMHHNLFAHNRDRNPRIDGFDYVEIINNVFYNWGDGPTKFSDKLSRAHVLNNYYKQGENSNNYAAQFGYSSYFIDGVNTFINPDSRFYFYGNIFSPTSGGTTTNLPFKYPNDWFLPGSTQFSSSDVTVQDAYDAYNYVLDNAGASQPTRDSVDYRVVSETRNREGEIIDSQDEVGGWPSYSGTPETDTDNDGIPDSWETLAGLNPNDPSDNNETNPETGYTWIEDYINSFFTGYVPTAPESATVSFAGTVGSVGESDGQRSVVVQLSDVLSSDVEVSYEVQTEASTATLGTDVLVNGSSSTTGSITISEGSSLVNLEVEPITDSLDEENETLVINLTGATSDSTVSLGGNTSHTVTIIDDDDGILPTLPTVGFTNTSASVAEEGGDTNIRVGLSTASLTDITLNYTVAPSSTVSLGSDLLVNRTAATSGTLTIPTGSTYYDIPIAIINDDLVEDDKELVLTLSNPSANATLSANTTFTLTLQDGDIAPPGPGNDYIFDDTDPEFSTTGSWVQYTDPAGEHYDGSHYYLETPAGGSSVASFDFTVPVGRYNVYAWWWDDTYRPTDVPFEINHSGGQDVVSVNQRNNGGQWNLLGTYNFDSGGSVDITDDVSSGRDIVADAIRLEYVSAVIQTPTVSFSNATGSVSESGEVFNAVINASSEVSQETTINYSVDTGSSSAALGSDVTVNGSSNTTGSVTMQSGSSTVNLPIQIIDNAVDASDKTLVINLTGASGADLGVTTTYTLTITDDDLTLPTVGFTTTSSSVIEAEGSTSLRVGLSSASITQTTVPYEVSTDSTVVLGSDLTVNGTTATSGTVTIPTGATYFDIPVEIVDDDVVEVDKVLILELSDPSANVTLSPNTTFTLTLEDGDVLAPEIGFSSTGASVSEAAGTVSATIQMSGTSQYAASFAYTVNATSTTELGTDVTINGTSLATGGINIPAGGTTASITIQVVDDSIVENAETLVIDLTNLDAASDVSFNEDTTFTLNISDNDEEPAPPEVCDITNARWGTSSAQSGETVTLTATGTNCDGEVADFVIYEVDSQGNETPATSNPLFKVFNGSTSITSWTVDWDDSVCDLGPCDPPEYYFVAEWREDDSVNATSGTLEIETTEAPSPTNPVGFLRTSDVVLEDSGGNVKVDITSSAEADSDITIEYAIPQGSSAYATIGDDVSVLNNPGSVTIPAGSNSAEIQIQVINDQNREPNEKLIINIVSVNGATLGGNGQYVLTIVNDDWRCSR